MRSCVAGLHLDVANEQPGLREETAEGGGIFGDAQRDAEEV